MFEYEGTQFTLDQVIETANNLGLTLNEYLEKNPGVKRIENPFNEGMTPDFQNPTAQGAVVEETVAPNMDLNLGSGFSGLSQENKEEVLKSINDIYLPKNIIPLGKQIKGAGSFINFASGIANSLKSYAETKTRGFLDAYQFFKPEFTEEQQNEVLNFVSDNIFQPVVDPITSTSKQFQEARQILDEIDYEDPNKQFTTELAEGNYGVAAEKFGDFFMDAIPSLGAAFAGPLGYAAIFSSAQGNAYEQKIDAGAEKGDPTVFGLSTLQGGIELFSEMITRGLVKGFGGSLIEKASPKAAKELYKALTKNITGRITTGFALEGGSETLAQESSRFIDAMWDSENVFGYKKEGSFLEYDWAGIFSRNADVFVGGGIIGGGISSFSGPIKAYAEERLAPNSYKKQNFDIAKNISKLDAQYRKNPSAIIDNEIKDLQNQILNNKKLNEKVLNSFTDSELIDYGTKKLQVEQAKDQIRNITDVETRDLAEKIIKKQEKKLDQQYNEQKALILMLNFTPKSTNEQIKQKVAATKSKKITDQINATYTSETTNAEWKAGLADEAIAKLVGDYNTGPLAGVIKSKITGEISRLPDFRRDDFISETVLALIPHIRNFKPELAAENAKNNLSGWINGFIDKKIDGVLGSKKATKEQFEQDVTEKIDLVDETDLNLESAKPETINKIFNQTGLTNENVNEGSKKILKGNLPGLTEQVARDKNPFLTAVEKSAEVQFFEPIYKTLGGNLNKKNAAQWQQILERDIDDFLQLVEESGNVDYNRIKNKYLKGIYKGKKIGRARVAQGGTRAGEGRYSYQTPTRQEAIDYFTKGGLTTLIERKKTYTKILAHATAKKGIAEVIKDPEVQKEFSNRQEFLGKEVPKNVQAKILASLDRVIKVLETPIRPKGTLTADFGVFIAEAAREIALRIAKGIRAALQRGISFTKAKKQVIQKASEELNLNNDLQKQFVKEVSDNITIEDVLTNKFEKTIEKVYTKVTTKRFESAINVQGKNLKEKLNSLKTKKAKQNLLNRYFKNISQVFQKSAGNKVWEGQNAKANYQYWQKELGVNLKDLGFTLVKTKFGQSIAFQNNKDSKPNIIFAPAGRPSLHKGEYDSKYYEKIIDEMDTRSEESKSYILSEISSLLDKNGKQAVLDFIEVQGFYSDSPLRLVGKLNKYEKGRGPFVYEHTPPIKSLQQDISNILNSTDNKRQILNQIKKILESSKVDIISKKSEQKLNELGRKTLGKDDSRYEGVINPENLIEFKRNNDKAKELYAGRNLNEDLNKIIEQKTGLPFQAKYSQAVAKRRGKRKGMFNFFIPYNAEDFQGLMYALVPKGKQGDAAIEWFRQNLFHPYSVAMENINRERMAVMNDFKALKQNISNVPKKLDKTILKGDFTNEDAIRMWIWDSKGVTADELGIAKGVKNQLVDVVNKNPDFLQFAEQLASITKNGYPKPDNYWNAGNITTDILGDLNTVSRKNHLEIWKNNVDEIFDQDMYNKLEAEFGTRYVRALKDILKRMESGRNRTGAGNVEIDNWLDWLNNSVGAIMFLNVRSAVLQTISSVNYMNWSDNNPLKAAKAFANQPQYWKDFSMIFNSDFLVERRGGLKINVNESEIAEMANKGGVKGAISYLLNKGFVLTRGADSFAIAAGGAGMYRNRVNTYLKQGGKAKELLVYNASPRSFNELGERTGLIYLATNKREANAYAKMNRGKVKNIYINENKVASEQDLIDTMNELNIDTSEGSLYELIDSRFDFYIGKKAMDKVTKALSEKGFLAAKYQDGAQVVSGKVESIVVFDKSVISDKKGTLKQGLSQKEAEQKAFQDFREITEEAQQSSRPDRISKVQAGGMGRVFLAFANTPMQYARLMKRSGQDIINRRGDQKTNWSKLMYYGVVQNFIFNALQKALFVLGFSDEEDENESRKITSVAEGMLDSILRGSGLGGNAVVAGKNFLVDIAKRTKKPRPNFEDAAWKLFDVSPPLDSKVTKVRSALNILDWQGDEIKEEGISINNPAAMAAAQFVSAFTNVPLDRVLRIYDSTRAAVAEDVEVWQRVALILGWGTWELGIEEEKDLKDTDGNLTLQERQRIRFENAIKKFDELKEKEK